MNIKDNYVVGDDLPNALNTTANAVNLATQYVLFADNYASIQDALNTAKTNGIPRVILDPTKTYSISSTLTIPDEICLDGGGYNRTSLAGGLTQPRAKISASAVLNPMISMGAYTRLEGLWIDGNNNAVCGVQCIDEVRPHIENCFIDDFSLYGVQFSGVLFATLRNNYIYNVSGYALDTLQTLGSAYYGVNVGVSEGNEYKGDLGAIRLEGILTSISDDFEFSTDFTGSHIIEVGNSVQSQLTMISPYFELTPTGSYNTIYLHTSASLSIVGGQAFGNVNNNNDVFVYCNSPDIVNISGSKFHRYSVVYEGTLGATSDVNIMGNFYENNTLINGLTGLGSTNSGLVILPGTRLGVTSP